MSEVVGLVAASGQFIEQSIKIVGLFKKFRGKFKDTPKEIEGWQEEVTSLSKVVEKIQNTPALQSDDLKPIINQCKSVSEEILKIFTSIDFEEADSFSHKSRKITMALSKEGDIRDLFARIERLKSDMAIQIGMIQINQNQEGFAHFTSVMEGMKVSFQAGTDEEQCVRALFLTDPVNDRERLITSKGHRTPGTCEWIPKTKEYQDWNAARTALLWIAGPPGKGKTFISIFLSQLLETSKPNATVIWFFCDNRSESRNNAVGVLRGLMIQLVMKHNHLIPFLLSPWKIQRETLFSPGSFETLWSIFISMLKALHDQEVCFVLDGLDECVESSLSLLLFKLKTLFQHPSGFTRPFNCKFIIASRENPQIIFESLSTFPRIALDDLQHDINLYIADRVAHLATVKHILNTPLQFQIETALRRGAEGTFLWVSFMSQDLENSTLIEIEDALAHVPQGLYPLYQRIINQIKPEIRRAVSDMLIWILFAKRPLTIAELCDAIQVKRTKALTPEQVCLGYAQACGHLLQLYRHCYHDDGTIIGENTTNYRYRKLVHMDGHQQDMHTLFATFVHQSAKDFLLSGTVDLPILRPVINPIQGHAIIADRLITLLCEHFSSDDANKTAARTRTPALSYAIDVWGSHIAESQDDCKDLLRRHPVFFGKTSEIRDKLWWVYNKFWDKPDNPPQDVPFLHLACQVRLYHLVEAWLMPKNPFVRLSRKRSINQRWGRFQETPLHVAVKSKQKETIRVLLRYEADVSMRNNLSKTPIHLALDLRQLAFTVKHEAHDTDIYQILAKSKTGIAVLTKEAKYYMKLPEKGRDKSLLHFAAEYGNEVICRDLIETFHYSTDVKTSVQDTPLHLALKNGQAHVANLLVTQWGASLHPRIKLLQAIIASNPADECFRLCSQDWGCDINITDELGNTIFHDPIFDFKNLQAIQKCQLTVDWDRRNQNGQTFLHSNITWLKDARLLYVFLKHSQLGINTIDNHGRTPLHALIIKFHECCQEYQKYLSQCKTGASFRMAEIVITRLNFVDIQALLDFGVDRSLSDDNGSTASDMVMKLLAEITTQNDFFTRVRDWAENAIETLASYETVAINPSEVGLRLGFRSWPSSAFL
ncbi:hypothetical protein EDB82DRAFT_482335 [Fusarium venenatum]|uniref:uncharacterized protein n=1 Tax=Fusarium venenatum TaxID=56646 RepID=UPI001DB049DE|nr:hypothetical protein EDB82DRAFT_482335 [Fusarium venenatum]